jgi:2-oxoglutarate dehydrogenase E2 component (dihydrolipoamide succinyltransferase)
MSRFELTLPAMGEGIIEAAITRWFVSRGDRITVDQPLLEVATDKVDSEIPSPVEGTVFRLVYREGEIPRVGEVIAIINTGSGGEAAESMELQEQETDTKPESTLQEDIFLEPVVTSRDINPPRNQNDNVFISPLVRLLAKQRGISGYELGQIRGTGLEGRIIKDDIHNYIIHRQFREDGEEMILPVPEQKQPVQEYIPEEDDEVIEMDRMRKLIASHMVRSKRVAPHVTSFLEADITPLLNWRELNKNDYFLREQVKLTFTPLFVEAVASALKDFPRINVSLDGERIILHKNINVGIATALPNGNLIVPVIRNADRESLGGIARKIADLAERARTNALLPSEIKGGTFTITNIGQYNNLTGTPIINQPESAILAIGTIIKKPWAVKTSKGYGLAVRDITMLSLTYDHRVIDGALGGGFLSRVAWYLEQFDPERKQ